MALTIRGKNIDVTPAIREYIEKRAAKLDRYFDREPDVQAVISVQKDEQTIELTCFVEGIVLRAVDSAADLYAAVDLVTDKVIRQIHKYKTRLARRLKKDADFRFEPEVDVPEETDLRVVRTKEFSVRPMDVEEAILQMNLVGHDFFMFLNADTDKMSVVYRRKNGSYGLIGPKE